MSVSTSSRSARHAEAARASQSSVKRLGSGLPFLVPFLIVAALFLILPILYGLWLSFTEQSLMGNGGWVGLDNYVEAFGDATMWQTLGHTVAFTVMSTIPLVLIALVMALLVYIGIPGQWFWRLAFFAPYLLPVAVVVQVWTWLFNSDVGFINYWIEQMGLDKVGWLTDVDVAMWSMVILTVWWTVGFNFLLYLSSLQAIPDLLYEAAEVDGAGFWRKLWSVTLPQLRGTTVLVATLQVIASLKIFDQMFIAFNGGSGPEGSTRPILQYIYDTGFTNYRMGYASAMSYIFFAVVIVITVVFQMVTRSRKGKNNER
ncbi:MAG: sugar ABC transporter permease [Actinomyces urogenitalis]|uniref:Sugar ABC transporter permease n=2 Tax=Actinomyces urogenitalis TaxID=103621 RepID=A0A2I1KSP4_9ACTO|nr:sugar ABC transporter permease [Actinomyces urogenitalis]ETJ07474.1 MAG: Sugar ABC superfamily ATP binding cassette transporter, membrane protein [Actinomyces urogenitalis DORA_12]KGF04023.1 sugar ABC transporter permease [Actinomyces urogenitalis S6-C4]MBS5977249.1 sugar ABC transporter permease [Actinomyces urogenitalis]MDK8238169.1 sugar ABC transporter permease [Actinomyces urogenitalis]MDK8835095.1 sugar ABC transporter permease [Actinomyces urogenitalis]